MSWFNVSIAECSAWKAMGLKLWYDQNPVTRALSSRSPHENAGCGEAKNKPPQSHG